MASILFRKGYVNHQEQSVGFVADLCVKPDETPNWGSHFIPTMQKELEENNCQYVFSHLEQFESDVYNTILRRRNRNSNFTRYHLFRKFYMVYLMGRKLWSEEPINSLKIDFGRTEDIEAICHYLREKSVRKPLFFNLTPEELERRFRVWPNFSVQNFLIARNSQGDILGCMAPWNNKHVQQYIPKKYHGKSFQIYSTAKTLSSIGLVRPFPKEGDPYKFKFVTHWAYDNPDIFYALINRAYNESNKDEIITYPNYMGDYATRPPASFFSVKVPHGLYSLLDGSEKLPSFLRPNPFTPPPDFSVAHY